MKVLCFDLDDTIWSCNDILVNAQNVMFRELETNYPEIFNKYSEEPFNELLMETYKDSESKDWTEIRKVTLKVIGEEFGLENEQLTSFVEQVFNAFFKAFNDVEGHIFEGVLDMFTRLKKDGYILGALTNGNKRIESMPVLHEGEYFTFYVNPSVAGRAKPDSKAFDKVLELARTNCAVPDLQKTDIIHIGDSLKEDIWGAKTFGFKTVWIDPKGKGKDRSKIRKEEERSYVDLADAIIEKVVDLPSVLKALDTQ